ncbi:MAG: CpsD/CapB family tyrosine-protein kinase [Roseiflexaceae bacterium]|nr:CpsD/CapB family tyrosine-protein kinase [Roseiflexaceae bacterium]
MTKDSNALPLPTSATQGRHHHLVSAHPPGWYERLRADLRRMSPSSGALGQALPAGRRRTLARGTSIPPELAPDSATMEACRLLRGNFPPDAHGSFAPLVVIAPAPGVACALVAAGLAITLAEEGRKTLLVDADMRAPIMHTLFATEAGPGFADMLAGGAVEHGRVVSINESLGVLPAGVPNFSPAVIFRRQRAAQVVSALTGQYDAVIYHIAGNWTSPELLALVPLIGTALFIIRAGVETADHIRRIKEPLARTGVRFLGFALIGDTQ